MTHASPSRTACQPSRLWVLLVVATALAATPVLSQPSDTPGRWDPVPDKDGMILAREPHGTYCTDTYIGVARFQVRVFVDKFERTFKFRVGGWPQVPMCRHNPYMFDRDDDHSGIVQTWRPKKCLRKLLKRIGVSTDEAVAEWRGEGQTMVVTLPSVVAPMLGVDGEVVMELRKSWCPTDESPLATNIFAKSEM